MLWGKPISVWFSRSRAGQNQAGSLEAGLGPHFQGGVVILLKHPLFLCSDQVAGEQIKEDPHPGGKQAHPAELFSQVPDQPELPLRRALVRPQALGRRRQTHPQNHPQLCL